MVSRRDVLRLQVGCGVERDRFESSDSDKQQAIGSTRLVLSLSPDPHTLK